MKNRRLFFTLLFFFLAAISWSLRFDDVPSVVVLQNNIDTEYTTDQNLTVKHAGDATAYFITFSAGYSGTFTERILRYRYFWFFIREMNFQIYNNLSDRMILKDTSYGSLSPDEVLIGQFDAASTEKTNMHSFSSVIPEEQFPVRGTYYDDIVVSLYQGTLDNHSQDPVDTSQIRFECSMPDYTKVAIVNTGDTFTPSGRSLFFDFGVLIWGESRECDVVVRSNNPYTFRIKSENLGVLKHIDPNVDDSVDYQCIFDGQILDLSSSSGAAPEGWLTGSTGYEGIRYPVEVIIQEYGPLTAGTYQDNISISITSY